MKKEKPEQIIEKLERIKKRKQIIKKLKRIFFTIIPVFIFLVVFIETELYYKENISNQCFLLLLSIMNGLRVFAIRSTIDIFDIVQKETSSEGLLRQLFDPLYVLCYFGAPIVTAKCFAQIYSYFAKEKIFNWGKNSKKERVVIVGYNKHVEILIDNILDSNKAQKQKKKIMVLHKVEIDSKQKFEYQKAGVLFKRYEKVEFNESEEKRVLKEIWRWVIPKKVKKVHIILFEEKEMDNISNYCFFLKCLEKEQEKARKKKRNRLKNLEVRLDCNYVSPQVEQLIWKCFEKKKGLLEYEYGMNTFSLPMLRAQSVLEKCKIYENIIIDQKECRDMHLLIIGFGKMGQRFLQRAVSQSIVSEKNSIIVDIVEKDLDKAKWHLEKTCKNFYDAEENIVHVGPDVTEGDLKIRLQEVNINNSLFKEYLDRMSKEMPFTYIAICIDSSEDSIGCMLSIEEYLQETNQKCPVLMRMDSGQKLGDLEKIYEELHMVPGDDDIMTLENICNQNYWEIDANIHKNDNEKPKESFAYQIESRKYRVLHYDAKARVYDTLTESDQEYVKATFNSEEYKNKQRKSEFADKVKYDNVLYTLGAIEHRRWSYYMILHGWKHGSKKDVVKKTTPYLCPFEEIIKDSELKKSVYFDYKDWCEIITKK